MTYPLDEMPRPIELEDAPSTFSVLCTESGDTESYLLADNGDTEANKAVIVNVCHTKQGDSHAVAVYGTVFGNSAVRRWGQLALNGFAPWRGVNLFGNPDRSIYFTPGNMYIGIAFDSVYGNDIMGSSLTDPWPDDGYTGGEILAGAGVSEDEDGEDGAELFSQFYAEMLDSPTIIAPEPRTERLTTDQISMSVRKLFYRYGVEVAEWEGGPFFGYVCFLYRWYDSGTATWGDWNFVPIWSNISSLTGRFRYWVGMEIEGHIHEGTTDERWFELPVGACITRPSSSKTKVRWKMGFVKPIEDSPYLEIDTSGPMTSETEYTF